MLARTRLFLSLGTLPALCISDTLVLMKERRRVLLYGQSLILGTVGVSLQRYPHLEVVPLSPPLPTAQELCALRPQVVIFDLESVPPEFPFSLLHEQPGLLVIGMDAAGDKLLVLSGQQARSLTTDDLIQMIETLPPAPEAGRG